MLKDIPASWLTPTSLTEATEVQKLLAQRVIEEDAFGQVAQIAGADVSNQPRNPDAMVHAAIAVLNAQSLQPTATADAMGQAAFPYVPGYLGFREVPWLVEAFRPLETLPDLIFVDGQGRSHPRGLGIACHLGVVLDRPTIGVAKSILIGQPARDLGPEVGDQVPLIWRNKTVGMVLRTKPKCNPLYISIGHRISLTSAVDWVLRCLKGYRLPEPTRHAHLAANAARLRRHELQRLL